MANEAVSRALSANRDVQEKSPTAEQDCSDVIHISVFFDGTGNNKDRDEEDKKWSNPARIWRSARIFADSNNSTYPIYISGVGTPFNGTSLNAIDSLDIKTEDNYLGGAFGGGGSRRLDFGRQQINDALRIALLQRATTLGGQVERHAKSAKSQSFSDINRSLARHRLIKHINISIFGFSRGAALARAFCNEWIWQCNENRGKLLYEGYPIRFIFLGLFDTVASFGLPATNMANIPKFGGFKGRDLVVDDRVERCVHYVAGNELRFSFPVDLIRKDGQLNGRWLEKVYPGMHSDVGGGYQPVNQGIDNNYARIPMRDMMDEALKKGARLASYNDISVRSAQIFKERFECKPATIRSYEAYKSACNPSGSVEHCMREHMKQLYSAYGTLMRQGGENVTQREHREGRSWAGGPKDMGTELETYERLIRELKDPTKLITHGPGYVITQGAYAMWIKPYEWQKQAWHTNASRGVMDFIHTYLHDSKVGFINNIEPFSYFSQRGISESSRSVYGWLEYNVNRPVDKAVESTVDYASEKAQQAKELATQAAEKIQTTARQTADYVGEKVQQAEQAVSSSASKAADAAAKVGKAASEATQTALDRLDQAWKELSH